MNLVVEERTAWVRTRTHTVVFDHEEDFPRFRWDSTGESKRLVRVWLAESGGTNKLDYLGACQLCGGRFHGPGVRTLLKRLRLLRGSADADELREMCRAVVRRLREVAASDPPPPRAPSGP